MSERDTPEGTKHAASAHAPMPDGLFREICDQVSIGVMCLSADLAVEYWNGWLVEKTGIRAEEARGRTLAQLFPGFHHPRFAWAATQVIKHRSPQILSQALNRYLIPIRILTAERHGMTLMQQNVTMHPLSPSGAAARILVTLADVTEGVVRSSALAALTQQLKEQTTRDPLTGAFNRRFMWEWLGGQLQLSLRNKRPMGCLMIDVDYFKRINDELGHETGDNVLKAFSSIIEKHLRTSDILVRYGGEEFVVLLPECDLNEACAVAKRICTQVASSPMAGLEVGHVTCSVGVACWADGKMATGAELLREADKQLYRAKNGGRNRVSPA
jgi:diguanylate cyclase (GGDEF)-like protein